MYHFSESAKFYRIYDQNILAYFFLGHGVVADYLEVHVIEHHVFVRHDKDLVKCGS